MTKPQPKAILVLPRLRVQNANAISSPLTHGFPSITAFMGLMWALERKLAQEQIALHLQAVGVICHHHQEQATKGFVRTFNQARNPVDEHGNTAAIVQEGRIHLDITLVFAVAEKRTAGESACLGNEDRMQKWADDAGAILAQMRVAGGPPPPPRPGPRQPPTARDGGAALKQSGRSRSISPVALPMVARFRSCGMRPSAVWTLGQAARDKTRSYAARCLRSEER